MISSLPRVIEGHCGGDHVAQDGSLRFTWAGLALIATVARLLSRELTLQNEYLRLENRILKSKVKGRLCFGRGHGVEERPLGHGWQMAVELAGQMRPTGLGPALELAEPADDAMA